MRSSKQRRDSPSWERMREKERDVYQPNDDWANDFFHQLSKTFKAKKSYGRSLSSKIAIIIKRKELSHLLLRAKNYDKENYLLKAKN